MAEKMPATGNGGYYVTGSLIRAPQYELGPMPWPTYTAAVAFMQDGKLVWRRY